MKIIQKQIVKSIFRHFHPGNLQFFVHLLPMLRKSRYKIHPEIYNGLKLRIFEVRWSNLRCPESEECS